MGLAAAAVAALWLLTCDDCPETRNLIVVQGASTMSSLSIPNMLAPLADSTPTTLKVVFLTRTSWPSGELPSNNSFTRVCPIRQTLLALRTSASVNDEPSVRSFQSRTSRNVGVVP